MNKVTVFILLSTMIFACGQATNKTYEEADMYDASELSLLMREMVDFSKNARTILLNGEKIADVPDHFFGLKTVQGTRDEQEEVEFQVMADVYLGTLKGIERGDSQRYYYDASIAACKTCHSTYCGGPMAVIKKLGLED